MSDRRALILRWLEEQEALCAAATPEGWSLQPTPSGAEVTITARMPDSRGKIIDGHLATVHVYEDGRQEEWRANASLIAASRTVLPLALAAIRATVEGIRHREVQDCWYSCPLAVDKWGESQCCNERAVAEGRCTCGADADLDVIFQSLGLGVEVSA